MEKKQETKEGELALEKQFYTHKVELLEKKFEEFEKEFKILVKVVDKLSEVKSSKENTRENVPKKSNFIPTGYVPENYRKIVDEILTPEFGLDCKEFNDSMDFRIDIIVPDKFNSLTLQEKQNGIKDIRSKVISRTLGENGVRDWVQKVRENLNKFYASSGVQSPFTN
jgi:hypothetical protein